MPSIYALLVGINGYPVKPLQGCVNDAVAVKEYLTAQYGNSETIKLNIKTLTDDDAEKPTRQQFINAFDFFSSAQNGDTCLFYYSGHGSFSPALPELDNSGSLNVQSYVCIDSRTPGGKDLVDKEMSFLIWKLLASKPDLNFIAITDCCYSGTITKALIDDTSITERMISGGSEHLPATIQEYVGFNETVNNKRCYIETTVDGKTLFKVSRGKHIHLAASNDNQTSKELTIDGKKRGAFTHSLLKNLYLSGGQINYQDLIDKTAALVKNLVPDQSPDINLVGEMPASEKSKIFLSQETTPKTNRYFVYHDPKFKWCIKGGTLHGITKGDKLTIETSEGVCTTTVVASPAPDLSVIAPQPQFGNTSNNYFATVDRQPNQDLKLSFATSFPDDIKKLITDVYENMKPPFITIPQEGSGQYIIRYYDTNEISITLPGTEHPVFVPQAVTDVQSAVEFLQKAETVSNWVHLYEYNNPDSVITNQHYTIELYTSVQPDKADLISLEKTAIKKPANELYYQQSGGEWHQPVFAVKFKNTSAFDLHITMAYLGFDYSITTDYFSELNISAGKEAYLEFVDGFEKKNVVPAHLDEKYQVLGYTQITEYLKIFISTQKISTTPLQQAGLDVPALTSKSAEEKGLGSTNNAGQQVAWKTETIGFTIIKPQNEKDIRPGETVSLDTISIEPHNSFQGKAVITGSQHTTKSADGVAAPHAANGNSYLEPFDLVPNTRSAGTVDVLELFDVKDRSVVTPEAPLIIQTPASADDNVWAMGYDEEEGIYYILGRTENDGKVHIVTLPEETNSDAAITKRSFTGSIKIYFQKVIGRKLGLEYKHPRLAIPTIHDNDTVTYESDTAEIEKEVKAANSILLFVHGIIGDTEGMVKCIQTPLDDNGTMLKNKYDLVLTFDYENLNTTIEETAKALKEKLAEVKLKEGHGKQLVIAAHSMGGLVSRVFIEQKGGDKIVNRLIMLGTPNNGTPWADVRDLAETLLTFAINGSVFLKPWMFVLSLVGKLVKGTQVTLKQMDAQSPLYPSINSGNDPGILYIIVAGDTRQITVKFEETASKIQKLFARLKQRGVYDALDAVLFKEANDIAVTNKSITSLPGSNIWRIKPIFVPVACDHMNYFKMLQAIQKLL